MKKMLKGAAAVLLSGSLLASPVLAATTPTFRDVAVTDWSYSFVTRAAKENLVSGMGDGTFGANKKLSSAQFITMVCNLFYRADVDTYQNTYKPTEWWRSFMAVAYGKGLLNNTVVGDSRTATKQWKSSVVNAEISRYDMAQIMVNVLTAQEWEGVTPQEVLQFQQTALGTNLSRSRQKNLHIRVGQHHGADIPAIHDHIVLTGHFPLHIQQHIPDHRMGRHQACLLGDILGADIISYIHAVHQHVLLSLFIIFNVDGQFINVTFHTVHILGADAQQVHKVRNGTVNGTGIHIVKAQFLCQSLGHGGFACTGRAVNCN